MNTSFFSHRSWYLNFLFATTLFSSNVVNANLIEYDLVSSGDRLTTIDTHTGLQWLDLTLTFNQSYDSIQGGFGGFVTDGFRYASRDEVLNLYGTAGVFAGATGPGSVHGEYRDEAFAGINYLNDLMGYGLRSVLPFDQIVTTTWGLTSETRSPVNTHQYLILGTKIDIGPPMRQQGIFYNSNTQSWMKDFDSTSRLGSYLVRTTSVPEPGTLLLLILGVTLIVVHRPNIRKPFSRSFRPRRQPQQFA